MLESSKGCRQRALERKRKSVSIPNTQKGPCEQKPWSASPLGGSPTCCLTEIPAPAWMQELEEMRVPSCTPYAALETNQQHPVTASPEVFGQERWPPTGFLVSMWFYPQCRLGEPEVCEPGSCLLWSRVSGLIPTHKVIQERGTREWLSYEGRVHRAQVRRRAGTGFPPLPMLLGSLLGWGSRD